MASPTSTRPRHQSGLLVWPTVKLGWAWPLVPWGSGSWCGNEEEENAWETASWVSPSPWIYHNLTWARTSWMLLSLWQSTDGKPYLYWDSNKMIWKRVLIGELLVPRANDLTLGCIHWSESVFSLWSQGRSLDEDLFTWIEIWMERGLLCSSSIGIQELPMIHSQAWNVSLW